MIYSKGLVISTVIALFSILSSSAEYSLSDTDSRYDNAGKVAFGYFSIDGRVNPIDALSYSYQFQSYFSDAGVSSMLYIDEMEPIAKQYNKNLRCGNKICALNTGRLLGVRYMGFGKVHKGIFSKRTIEVGIVDVEHGTLIFNEKRQFKGDKIDFLSEMIPDFASKIGEVFENKGTNNYISLSPQSGVSDRISFSNIWNMIMNLWTRY